MFPKIELKIKSKSTKECLYPKPLRLNNKIDRDDNISQLKKLRQFLDGQQVVSMKYSLSQKQSLQFKDLSLKQSKHISAMSTIDHIKDHRSNLDISPNTYIKAQISDRPNNNTSDNRKRRITQHLQLQQQENTTPLRYVQQPDVEKDKKHKIIRQSLLESYQRRYNFQKQKTKLKDILDFMVNQSTQQISSNNLAKYKLL